MIAVRDEDVVLALAASDKRFLLFTSTDVQPDWLLRWWGVVLDIGGDAHGILVRLDASAAPAGWTASQLMNVAAARAALEARGSPAFGSFEVVDLLAQAGALLGALRAEEVPSFTHCGRPSPYPWTQARMGAFCLPLCPDDAGDEEGVTQEQLLLVLERLLRDGVAARPWWLEGRRAAGLVSAALAAERRRLAATCQTRS